MGMSELLGLGILLVLVVVIGLSLNREAKKRDERLKRAAKVLKRTKKDAAPKPRKPRTKK